MAEIEDLVQRDATVEKPSDSERLVFERRNAQIQEEFERIQEEKKVFKEKLGGKFDSFAVGPRKMATIFFCDVARQTLALHAPPVLHSE